MVESLISYHLIYVIFVAIFCRSLLEVSFACIFRRSLWHVFCRSLLYHSTWLGPSLSTRPKWSPPPQPKWSGENVLDLSYKDRKAIGWLRLVGSFKLLVSFAEYRLFYRALLQKRPIIWRSLLVEATPWNAISPTWFLHGGLDRGHTYIEMCVDMVICICICSCVSVCVYTNNVYVYTNVHERPAHTHRYTNT